MVLGIICVKWFGLQTEGVKIVGTIPSGLPSFKTPFVGRDLIVKVKDVSEESGSVAVKVITGFV